MKADQAKLRTLLSPSGAIAGPSLTETEIAQLAGYYALVLKWNPPLHLTTVTEPAEFLQRHLLESHFLAQRLLPMVTDVWDLGSGLGIPGVPLAILRPDLRVVLVEANRRKAVFLEEVAASLKLEKLRIENRRIETLTALPPTAALTARAVDKMQMLLPHLLRLGKAAAQMLLLGGAELAEQLRQFGPFNVETELLPASSARFLITSRRST